jgi:hypothetical protein
MESIKINILNEVLSSKTRKNYFLSERRGVFGVPDGSEGSQGDYNEIFKYYRHPDMPENVFLQITEHSDSYGDNFSITDIKLVEGKAKTVTVYEPIN